MYGVSRNGLSLSESVQERGVTATPADGGSPTPEFPRVEAAWRMRCEVRVPATGEIARLAASRAESYVSRRQLIGHPSEIEWKASGETARGRR